MKTRNRNLTALLLLFGAGDLAVAQDSSSAIETSTPASTQQVAPAEAVLPQDVPQTAIPTPTPTPLSATDQEFLRKALAVITAERELGKLASERGETEEVKALGAELLTSQVKNGAALQELAKLKNFELNLPPNNPHQDALASFQAKIGASFDSAFREHVAHDRSTSIQIFALGAKSTKDPAVRGLAEQMLTELKKKRPLAAAEAATSAQKSREISKVAVKAKPAKPAAQQGTVTAGAPTATNPQSPMVKPPGATASTPSPVPPTSTAVTSPSNATKTTAAPGARAKPAGVSSAEVATPPITPEPPAPTSISASTDVSPTPVRRKSSEQSAPQTSINEPTATFRSTNGTPTLPPLISRNPEPTTVHSNPTVADPSRIVESTPSVAPTQNGKVRQSTSGIILEAPTDARNNRAATRVETKPARRATRSASLEETLLPPERTNVLPKRQKTATIQEAPRPRVVRRVNEEDAAGESTAPPKVIRRKIFQSSKDDHDDEDED